MPSPMRARFALTVLLAAAPCAAQSVARPMDDGLGVDDRHGAFYTISNRRADNGYIQITKLTHEGAWLWNVPFVLPGYDISATAATVDQDGNLIIAGTYRDRDHRDLLVVKYTAVGNFYWKQVFEEGGNTVPTVVAADDKEGNIYVAATVSEPGGSRLQVARFSPAGVLYWNQPYRGGRTTYARTMLIDGSGNALLTVDTTYGDANQGTYQTRQIIFTTYGAVYQP